MFLLVQSVLLVIIVLKDQVCLLRALQDITVTLLDYPQLLASVMLATIVMDHHLFPVPSEPHMEQFVHQVFIVLREALLLYPAQWEHSLLVHLILMSVTVYNVLGDNIVLHPDSLHQTVSVVREFIVLQDKTALREYHVQQEVIALGVVHLVYHVNLELTNH